jgi:hypothetical protein
VGQTVAEVKAVGRGDGFGGDDRRGQVRRLAEHGDEGVAAERLVETAKSLVAAILV